MNGGKSILLTTEGTYPFHAGGVSRWCDNLIEGLDEFSFTIYAIMMNPYISYKYDLPQNVSRVIRVPLWGIEEPAEYIQDINFSRVYLSKRKTTGRKIKKIFLPLLKGLLREMADQEKGAKTAGETFYKMHLYFKNNDYNETFKSRLVWDAFCQEMLSISKLESENNKNLKEDLPRLYNFTECLRWLYRFLIPLVAEIPKTDLVHSTAAAFCSIPCVIGKLAHGTPFLLTEHGVYLREQYMFVSKSKNTYHSKKFLLNLIGLVSRMSYHYADQISPVCNYNATWEEACGAKREKIRTIYNGVDPRGLTPKKADPLSHSVVVSATRVDPLKDIETLIRASRIVRQKVADVRFIVYGSLRNPWYHEHCLKLIHSLGLDGVFIFAGHNDDLNHIYGEGDIIALSSISEAFPYTVIEAMMCGKAVVATDVGGVREALEGCGILVGPKDPEGFGQAILQLLEDPELRSSLGAEAREKALNNFTVERTNNQYKESYLRLCSGV